MSKKKARVVDKTAALAAISESDIVEAASAWKNDAPTAFKLILDAQPIEENAR